MRVDLNRLHESYDFVSKAIVLSENPWHTLSHEYDPSKKYRLLPQNDNKYDSNAVKIMCTDGFGKEEQVGWVPMRLSALVSGVIRSCGGCVDIDVIPPLANGREPRLRVRQRSA